MGSNSDFKLLKFVLKITAAKKIDFERRGGGQAWPQVRIYEDSVRSHSFTRLAAGSAWRGVFEQASLTTAAPV